MSRIKVLTALVLAAAVVVTAGCSREDRFADIKVYRHSAEGVPTNLDPLQAGTIYANLMVVNAYDTLYRYRYLARPYELAPNLAAGMPEVSDDRLTYTIRIKPGVEFADDPAFARARGREVVAEDFVYSIKRHYHPANVSQGAWVWEGKIDGLREWAESGADYDAPIAGLRALDDHTIRITLTRPFPQLVHTLAMGFAALVPREAVEHHGREFARRPVGSGPFRLVQFSASRAVFEPNPKFREEPLNLEYEGYDAAAHGHLGLERLDGLAPPYVDRLEIDFIEETSARWASFTSGREIQYTVLPAEQTDAVLASRDPVALKPSYAERYHMQAAPESTLVLYRFNMEDPAIGVHPDPVRNRMNHELRCALRDAFSWEERNTRFYHRIGIVFPGLIPPVSPEFDPDADRDSVTTNVERGKQRLKAVGWNAANLPVLQYGMPSTSTYREMFEQFRGSLARIGYPQAKVRARAFATFGDFNRAMSNKEVMIMGIGWSMSYPDAEYVFQTMYGPNEAPGANRGNYKNPEFDALFERSAVLDPGPERTELYRRMNQIVIDDCVGIMSLTRQRIYLWHKNVIGLPDRDILHGYWLRFADVEGGDGP